jgi:purine-binding chemotaxis protein CheW
MNKENLEKLKNRAIVMAEETVQKQETSSATEVITFILDVETYAIESAFVREVYQIKDFTTLPGVPSFIFCIINIRGQILPVIDLKKFFNLPEKGFGELNKVIILSNDLMEFGILADEVRGTETIEQDDLQPVPQTISSIGEEFLRGVTKKGLILLNAERMLSDKKLVVYDEVN